MMSREECYAPSRKGKRTQQVKRKVDSNSEDVTFWHALNHHPPKPLFCILLEKLFYKTPPAQFCSTPALKPCATNQFQEIARVQGPGSRVQGSGFRVQGS